MEKDELTKSKILAAAAEILKTDATGSFTVSDICSSCSISKTTFYKYFTSKEALIAYFQLPDKRALILEQAMNLMKEKGFDQVTMSDIAKASGMNRSSLYSYFSDISEVAKGILAKEFANITGFEEIMSDSRLDTSEKLSMFLDFHLSFLKNKENLRLALELLQKCNTCQDIKEGFDRIESLSIANLKKVIEMSMPDKADFADTYASMLCIFTYGIAIYSFLHPDSPIVESIKQNAVELILNKA